jgi:hypothetical protein
MNSFGKIVVILAASIALAPNANAQVGPQFSIGANAGLAIPVSDLSSFTSSGYTVAITLGMHQPMIPLSFRAEGSFTELPWSDNTGASGARHRIFGLAVDGQYNLGTPSTNGGLYVTGGAGTYGSNDVNLIGGDSDRQWNFGINAGLGYYLPLSGFTMYFEGRYQNIFGGTNHVLFPITVGLTF